MNLLDFMLKEKTCCFIGHRKIDKTDDIVKRLYSIIETLIIDNNIEYFLFGSKSEFNDLCLEVVTNLKEQYPHIKRIYIRSAFPDISEDYEEYLLERYEETYFPENVRNAGKASYVKRNQEMIDKSTICIVYYDKNYLLQRNIQNKNGFVYKQSKSGTGIAYNYASKRGNTIINLFEKCDPKSI